MAMAQLPKPAMPHMNGSTTPWTSAHAMAASTALPPALRMSAPASAASGCGATIIAFFRYRMEPPRCSDGHRVAEGGEAVLTRDDARAMLRRLITHAPHRARREAFVILRRDP